MKSVISAVYALFSRGIQSIPLCTALKQLYTQDSQHEKALDILLYMQNNAMYKTKTGIGEVFDYIEQYGLYSRIAERAYLIVNLDAERAVQLLLQYATHDTRDLHRIVEQLKPHSKLVHVYLRGLFDFGSGGGSHNVDIAPGYPKSPRDYHTQQIALFAKHQPDRLDEFLRTSMHYNAALALDYCQTAQLHEQVVFLLGRSKRYKEALDRILDKNSDAGPEQQDFDFAIKFVKERGDDDGGELWNSLINRGLTKPEFVSKLLAQVGLHVNPREFCAYLAEIYC